jgi:hypothetical protein
MMEEIKEEIEKAGLKLAEIKEAFIVDEITPYLKDGKLTQKLRVRLQEKKDWELKRNSEVREIIRRFEAKRRTDNADYIEFDCKDWFEFKKQLGVE